ncbi:hypothetical protein [Streptomyces sp. WAC 00631]|nr:hypothetical protein [Streptomyces sp. WAC 00631]
MLSEMHDEDRLPPAATSPKAACAIYANEHTEHTTPALPGTPDITGE